MDIQHNSGQIINNSNFNNSSVTQINLGDVDLNKLTSELADLGKKMSASAKVVEQMRSVVQIEEAEKAAQAGDARGVLDHLKAAGKWALETAKAVGLPLAVKALETALKL